MDESIVFKVSNLSLYYGQKQALNDININIYRNKVTALIGPSGCGKSTFLRCFNKMNNLIKGCTIKGEILYNELNLNEVNDVLLRSKVGMVFQESNLFPMSIFDNVAYGPRCMGIKNKKVLEALVIESLKKVALYEEIKDRLHGAALALSGGQRQRLCIARCIAMNPEVILMDEPTSALDPIATLKIEELINSLKKDYTIIIVTHNMQQATRISDYTAFFYLGSCLEYNKTKEVFTSPQNKKCEDYITGRFG